MALASLLDEPQANELKIQKSLRTLSQNTKVETSKEQQLQLFSSLHSLCTQREGGGREGGERGGGGGEDLLHFARIEITKQ